MRRRVQKTFTLPSRTQQHMKNECDINKIMEKYRTTGIVTHVNKSTPKYGDFSAYGDFRQNLHTVMDANDSFLALPASVRKKFGNDPANLIDFLQDPSNADEAIKLGLMVRVNEAKNDDLTTKNASTNTEPKAQAQNAE